MFFRNILSACESHGSHSIRLILTYQFAEFLLRKVSPKYYSLPTQNSKFIIRILLIEEITSDPLNYCYHYFSPFQETIG